MISFDTEATGLDVYHGARPYLITITDLKTKVTRNWQWRVDPRTRNVYHDDDELDEIISLIDASDGVVGHNVRFDISMLNAIRPDLYKTWDWDKTHDTMVMAHLLGSNDKKDLTSLCVKYLDFSIQKYEDDIGDYTEAARRYCRSHLHGWRIAKKGLPEMPSATAECWKADMWLPKEVMRHRWATEEDEKLAPPSKSGKVSSAGKRLTDYRTEAHPWWTALEDYADIDSSATAYLFEEMYRRIEADDLLSIYEEQMRVLRVVSGMERRGITLSGERLEEMKVKIDNFSEKAKQTCEVIANKVGYWLDMPKSGRSQTLEDFVFGVLKMPTYAKTKGGKPSMGSAALKEHLKTLDKGTKEQEFFSTLINKRGSDTAKSYLDGYKRYWLNAYDIEDGICPICNKANTTDGVCERSECGYADPFSDWKKLHPSLNISGTDTLRCSSKNPNGQNLSKKKSNNLRYCFGPLPGREWWSIDYENIELRIPAYASGEEAMIDLFERPKDPPFYGSNHLLAFSVIYPDIWQDAIDKVGYEKAGTYCKDTYDSTWYQWCKNGNFARQYGAQREKADETYRRDGSFDLLRDRFPRITEYNLSVIAHAEKYGYVETLADMQISPNKGYPIRCEQGYKGRVKPTIPMSYLVQSTAMWCTRSAMVLTDRKCEEWTKQTGEEHYLTAQVHDEIVFDLPAGTAKQPWKTNLPKARELASLMCSMGGRIGVPLRASIAYIESNWSEKRSMSDED